VRPRAGVQENSDLEKSIIKMVTKYNGFVASEMEDHNRHLHGQMFFEKPKSSNDVNEKMLHVLCDRHITDWDMDQKRCLFGGTRHAYNDDWYLNYTNKPDSIMLADCFDNIKDRTPYYPTKEEQEKAKARTNAVDKTFHHLSELYAEDPCPLQTVEQARKWFYTQMYVKKRIRVIEDKRKFNQRVNSLFHYLHANPEKYEML
jgi:hypothetical protein